MQISISCLSSSTTSCSNYEWNYSIVELAAPQWIWSCPKDHFLPPRRFNNYMSGTGGQFIRGVAVWLFRKCLPAQVLASLFLSNLSRSLVQMFCTAVLMICPVQSINQQIFMWNACSITTAYLKLPLCCQHAHVNRGQGQRSGWSLSDLTRCMLQFLALPKWKKKKNQLIHQKVIEYLLCHYIFNRFLFILCLMKLSDQGHSLLSFLPFFQAAY